MYGPREAQAHEVLPSALVLSIQPGEVQATLHLPAAQLGLALAPGWGDPTLVDLATAPERVDDAFVEGLRRYVGLHLELADERGVTWREEVGAPRWVEEHGQPHLVVQVELRSPDGHDPAALRVRDEVISEEVLTHRTLVTVARDFERAQLDGEVVVATLRYGRRSVELARGDASAWRGAWALLALGAQHVAEGLDHLLFVLVLLLSAPLMCARGAARWQGYRKVPGTIRHVAGMVTAFTVGHSVTLALAATGLVRVPSAPVEVLVGLSIGLGALHAIRPWFPGREAVVAGTFGLVHGLAFASTLEGFGLAGRGLLVGLAAFNVGIELVQLALILVFAPLLALAARRASYRHLRVALAALALVASAGWVSARLGGANPLADALERWAAQPAAVGARCSRCSSRGSR
ncbi:MAG: HupE/UreJ family protein [Deltaproteobacteria bacterium]|nr:HupE/UreJ family protein [Deltaproteobacteria bacterium]